MASTARKDKDKKEYFDSPDELERKVHQLVEWIKESKHFFVFTVRARKRERERERGREGGRR